VSAVSGRLLFANLGTKGARKLARKLAERELGRAISKIAFGKRTLRFVGKQWEFAFKHITEHFSAKTALLTRKTAGVYLARFRSEGAVQNLIKSAVARSSNRLFTRSFVHTVAAGEPVTIVEREFSFVIGESFKQLATGEIVKEGECKVLRVIFNVAGEVITAFPVTAINAGL
jgi:hypothetical protein